MRRAIRIAIASQKGGVGKTTVSLNLSLALATRGRPTLLADLDPQGAVGLSLAKSDTHWAGLAELLMNECTPDDAVVLTHADNLALLPRGRLDPVDVCEFEEAVRQADLLEPALAQASMGYDYLVIDTPSGLGAVTRGALAVADFVVVPTQASALGVRSIGQALRVIDHVQRTENPRLKLLGILPTMVDLASEASQQAVTDLWNGFSGVFDTVIPFSTVFPQASHRGVPVDYMGGPSSPEARRFDVLASEIETRIRAVEPKESDDEQRPERRLV